MVFPIITAITGGVIIILQMALQLSVSMARMKYGYGIGGEENGEMALVIRRHANLTENAAIYLIILALLEMAGISSIALTAFAGLFVACRLLHVLGMSRGAAPNIPRFIGGAGTMVLGVLMGGWLIWIVIERTVS